MIDKVIFWNIRSVNTQKSFEQLIDLKRRHHYKYIAIMEPFRDPSELEHYRRKLGYTNALVNRAGKIWIFWDDEYEGQTVSDTDQQLTVRLTRYNTSVLVSAVYAKCSNEDRIDLWKDLEHIAEGSHTPWVMGGDFNVILREEENMRGLAFTQAEAADFAQCINNCALSEIKFTGS